MSRDIWMLIFGVLFCLGCFLWVFNKTSECSQAGGTLVRGVFFYECVGRR